MEIGHKMKPDAAAAAAARFAGELHEGEQVLFVGTCSQFKPQADRLIVTTQRVLAGNAKYLDSLTYKMRYDRIRDAVPNEKKQTFTITDHDGGSVTFKMVAREDHATLVRHVEVGRALPVAVPVPAPEAESPPTAEGPERSVPAVTATPWPNTRAAGSGVSAKASRAIRALCHAGEDPWLMLSAGSGGVLAAFEDRLVIVKTGAMTSFLAGSLGGERSATFYYRDITGLEYNSGLVTGVLEVLTASYSGTATKDYWNAGSKDPFTLSNTLPLAKFEYRAVQTEINDLRARISKAKDITITVAPPSATPVPGLADELRKLADLRDAGVLTPDEFAAAKARLLAA